MLGLCRDEKYGAKTNHDNRDDDENNDKNYDENKDDNAASGLGSDGPIFDLIKMPRSRGGGLGGDNTAAAATYVSTHWNIYTL